MAIQKLQIASAGVANAQPDLTVPPYPVPPAQCDPTNSDPTKPCMAQAVPLGQAASVKVFGQGFGVSAGTMVRLDAKVSGACSGAQDASFCTTYVSDSEVDVTIPASMLTVAHDYALDVQAGGVVSNSIDLHAVGVMDLSGFALLRRASRKDPKVWRSTACGTSRSSRIMRATACRRSPSIRRDL